MLFKNLVLAHDAGKLTDYSFLKEVDTHLLELKDDDTIDNVAVSIWEFLLKKNTQIKKNRVDNVKRILSGRLN